jgi:hypothetical protein
VGGNTPCSNPPSELDKSVINLTCVIRNARAFAEIVAAAVARSSEGLNQWAELKREWRAGQKREGVPGRLTLPLIAHVVDTAIFLHQEKPHLLICSHKLECVGVYKKSVDISCE